MLFHRFLSVIFMLIGMWYNFDDFSTEFHFPIFRHKFFYFDFSLACLTFYCKSIHLWIPKRSSAAHVSVKLRVPDNGFTWASSKMEHHKIYEKFWTPERKKNILERIRCWMWMMRNLQVLLQFFSWWGYKEVENVSNEKNILETRVHAIRTANKTKKKRGRKRDILYST